MESVTCFCIVLAEILCFVQAQTFEIKKEFVDGNLIFTWTNVSTRRNDIKITKNGSESDWIQITDDKYTVLDVWKHKPIKLLVREYTSADHRSSKDYYSTYTDMTEPRISLNGNPGSTIKVQEDDTVRISCHGEGDPLPDVSVSKAGQPIRGSSGHGSFNHTFSAIQCLDTDTYTCISTNEVQGSKETNFSINVLCTPRLDIFAKFQYVYWSTSGSDVKLNVVVPVISNPLPDNNMFSWLGPRNTTSIINTVVKQKDDVKYKYRIISTISVTHQTCFGSYTLRYNGRDIVTITINDKDLRDPSSKTEYRLQIIVIGVSVALFIIIVVGTVAVMAYVRRKKLKQQQPQQDRISAIITIDDSPQPDQVVVTDNDTSQPDQVQYAVVDRNTLMRNRNQTNKGTDDVIKNKNDDNDAAYAKTEESTLMTKTENRTNGEKATPQGDDEKTDTNNGNTEPRTMNQEGLIYIDVAFANKPESSNTNKKPVVHGKEDKTEYTFVDFSKKAPPIQEIQDDNNSD